LSSSASRLSTRVFGGGAVRSALGGDDLLGSPPAFGLGRLVQDRKPPAFPNRGLQCRVGCLPPLRCRTVFTLLLANPSAWARRRRNEAKPL
jgi:hypothetical protein